MKKKYQKRTAMKENFSHGTFEDITLTFKNPP